MQAKQNQSTMKQAPRLRNPIRPSQQTFRAMWDEEGVYVYQAFNERIAGYALEHQTFGGPDFNPTRMTWIKPSFGWVLFRSGYAGKHNQGRVLRIKIGHDALARLLSRCVCKHGGGGSKGRIQWDPERDMWTSEDGKEPRRMNVTRAIQIGMSKELSELYVESIIGIEDVTELAKRVHAAHMIIAKDPKSKAMLEDESLLESLPDEREYIPHMDEEELERIGIQSE